MVRFTTWASVRLRAADLLEDTAISDGGEVQRPYDVLRNQSGHLLIGMVTVLLPVMAGAPPLAAAAMSALAWPVAWEGAQYLRARRSGASPTRTRRDWLLGDGPAYLAGEHVALAVCAWEFWWALGASALAAGVAVGAALIFGRAVAEGRT